jgi:hypothetical protein
VPLAASVYLSISWCVNSNFSERRKIERMIRRLDKQHRTNADDASNKLSTLREDLEYVRVSSLQFFLLFEPFFWHEICYMFRTHSIMATTCSRMNML